MPSNLTSRRCAGCKYLRRRCAQDCPLAPYFPPNNPQRFESVHKIFGASNITKLLQQVPVGMRGKAADCMSFEASARVTDPVYGCVGMIHQLQEQITKVQWEVESVKGMIAIHRAQHQLGVMRRQQEKEQMMMMMMTLDVDLGAYNLEADDEFALPDFGGRGL